MKGKKIYIVGIGGIGLSALAQLLVDEGARVSGSDRAAQPTTELLRERGVVVHLGHSAEQMPEDTELLIYSDAVVEGSEGFAERQRAAELGIHQLNYFEALGMVAEGKRAVAVSGTHGKTTTTALLGKILIDGGLDPTIVVGSIVPEWGSNYRAGSSDLFIVEACEYKKHFLNFHPDVLVITNIEYDHTDFYKNLDELIDTFREMSLRVTEQGTIVLNEQERSAQRATEAAIVRCVDYSKEAVPELKLPGEFNRMNARAAKAAARAIAPGLSEESIDRSLAAFSGTWRRFEYRGTLPGGAELYDDYAHHPTAISLTIAAAREKFPGKKIVVFFHPHLYSRTRDLWEGFVESLAQADEAYILPVYAAREKPDPTVSNAALAQAITERRGHAEAVADLNEVTERLCELGPDAVAFTMGAGDVYKAGDQALKEKALV